MFDLAGHYLSRSTPAGPGLFHIDARLTGRPQRILFGVDRGPGLIAWHAPTATTTIRLPGAAQPRGVVLDNASLLSLLNQTLPIGAISSLSIWADTAEAARALLEGLAPFLSRHTQAVLRLSQPVATEVLEALPTWPLHCAMVLPCTGAADHEGRGEDPSDLLLCLERLSPQTVQDAAAQAAALPHEIRRDTWNEKDRAWRLSRQGGVALMQPLPDTRVSPGWTLTVEGESPATPVGLAAVALQSVPYRAGAGLDYVADIDAATMMALGGSVFIVPQEGPVLIDPAMVPSADADPQASPATGHNPTNEAARALLAGGSFGARRLRPIHTVSDRPAFLLGNTASPIAYLTELWPRLEYLFQICEQERLDVEAFDIVVPGGRAAPGLGRLVPDSLTAIGIPAANIRTDIEGMLFRRLLVATPASRSDMAQRSLAYEQFLTRFDSLRHGSDFVSFSRPRAPSLLFLTCSEGPQALNGEALAAAAVQRGWHVVDTQTTSFEDLAVLLAGARAIVGTGQALAWSCLARGCALGVLLADTQPSLPYAALHAAAARGHTVSLAFGTSIGYGDTPGFALAQDRLEALLGRIEAGLAGNTARGQAIGVAR